MIRQLVDLNGAGAGEDYADTFTEGGAPDWHYRSDRSGYR